MKFLEIFIERPRVLLLTLTFIILAGVSSVLSLPIQENPELAQRWGSVTTTYPGATPERIETQVGNSNLLYCSSFRVSAYPRQNCFPSPNLSLMPKNLLSLVSGFSRRTQPTGHYRPILTYSYS